MPYIVCKARLLTLLYRFICIAIIAIFFPTILFSQGELAQFQLIVPAPDPVQAGEKITFQIIVANTGKATWGLSEAEIEVEVYDSKQNYLIRADKVKSKDKVLPGGTLLEFIPFTVPTSFSGPYYFRVSITFKGQRTAYSDFLQFNVSPVESTLRPPAKLRVGGNAIFSYKNDSKDDWKNYIGNMSMNLLGSIQQKAFVGNVYTNHTRDKTFDLYNFIFSYYGSNFDLAVGDVMPSFSALSLSNAGMRGILPVFRWKSLTTSIVTARSIEPQEGTTTSNGNYARYVTGGYEEIGLPYDNSMGISFVTNSDDRNSIRTPGPSLTPIGNRVIGVNVISNSLKYVVLKYDLARSFHSSDTITGNIPVEDNAYRVGLERYVGPFSFRGGYQFVGTDFNSPGSPIVIKDRISKEGFTGLNLSRLGNISISYTDYEDNLKNDPNRVTTAQRIYSTGVGITLPKLPVFILGLTKNEVSGKEEEEKKLLNNFTNVISGGIIYSFPSVTVSVSGQKSNFEDRVTDTNNTETISGNTGTTFQFKEKLSVNFGFNNTNIQDLGDFSKNTLNTLSVTTNLRIVPEKVVLVVWGNTTQRSDNDKNLPAETIMRTENTEVTYYFNRQFAWTIGAGVNEYKDRLNQNNDHSENRMATRISLSF